MGDQLGDFVGEVSHCHRNDRGFQAHSDPAQTCFFRAAVTSHSLSGTSPATSKTTDTQSEVYTATPTSSLTAYVTMVPKAMMGVELIRIFIGHLF